MPLPLAGEAGWRCPPAGQALRPVQLRPVQLRPVQLCPPPPRAPPSGRSDETPSTARRHRPATAAQTPPPPATPLPVRHTAACADTRSAASASQFHLKRQCRWRALSIPICHRQSAGPTPRSTPHPAPHPGPHPAPHPAPRRTPFPGERSGENPHPARPLGAAGHSRHPATRRHAIVVHQHSGSRGFGGAGVPRSNPRPHPAASAASAIRR